MKKLLVVVLVVAVTLIGASAAMAKIANSKHDLSTAGGQYTGGSHSACAYCHTPHNGLTTAPLWNRADPTTTGYTMYTTVDGVTVGAPGSHSLTCLSCHDGTIGVGTTAQFTDTVAGGSLVAGKITGTAMIGPNLSNDHPVGVEWGRTGNTAGLTTFTPNGNNPVVNNGAATAWRLYGPTAGKYYVECGSCHDPHSDDKTANTAKSPFLKGDKGTICVDCHGNK